MSAYFQTPLGVNHVPDFLRASTASGLRRLMVKNNLVHKGFVQYFDIQYVEKDKSWFAWFFVTIDNLKELEQLEGGE